MGEAGRPRLLASDTRVHRPATVTFPASPVEFRDGNERVQTTAGAVLREALPYRFTPLHEDGSVDKTPARQVCQIEEGITGSVTIKTPDRTIKPGTLGNGSSFVADVVAALIKIDQTREQRGFHPLFFYYDRDHVIDDVHDSFSFFVVNDDRIVLDRVTFSRHRGSGFDPRVFEPFYEVKNQIWRSEPHVEEAKVRWWYRRFYQETDAGRLTTLREDVDLYHYVPDWKQRQLIAATIEQIGRKAAQVHKLLIYMLIALGLILILLWRDASSSAAVTFRLDCPCGPACAASKDRSGVANHFPIAIIATILVDKVGALRLEPLGTPQITNMRAGGGAALALTGGLFGSKNLNYRVRGETASVRAPTDAVFYYYALGVYGTNADGVILLRLQKKGREREYTFARAGGPGGVRGAEGDVELTVEKVAEGIYRLTPKSPLTPGEYGLAESTGVAGPGAVYDFGVDGPQKK